MKLFFIYSIALLLINNVSFDQISALENEVNQNNSSIIIANKYAEIYCSAKADNFFEGLENEKNLKYSYFKYIGFHNQETSSNDFYKYLIQKIKEKCAIRKEEEKEIKEFYMSYKK